MATDRLLLSSVQFRKLPAVTPPPSPQPSPPEAGGEGGEEAAGFSNHKALNQVDFSPSPPMGA